MIWVDLIIVVVTALSLLSGYRRGGILVAIDLAGYLLATIIAVPLAAPLGRLIGHQFHIYPAFAGILAFSAGWLVVMVAYMISIHRLVRRLPRAALAAAWNKIMGAVLNALKAVILIALALIVFAGLPVGGLQKSQVTDAALPKLLLSSTGQLQRQAQQWLGDSFGDNLNFFTVKPDPESTETIQLGFTTTRGSANAALEEKMLLLVNRERISRGLRPLTMNQKARQVARAHSTDMLRRGYFSHLTPEGQDPFDRMKAGGVKFGAAGENLALASTLQLAHNGLMNSPGHRANILSADYGSVGIGVIDAGPYGLMITQDFTD